MNKARNVAAEFGVGFASKRRFCAPLSLAAGGAAFKLHAGATPQKKQKRRINP